MHTVDSVMRAPNCKRVPGRVAGVQTVDAMAGAVLNRPGFRGDSLNSQRARNWPHAYATHRLGYDYRKARDTVAGHHSLPSADRCGLAFRS